MRKIRTKTDLHLFIELKIDLNVFMEIHLFPGNCIEIGMSDRYLRVLINFSIYPVLYGLTLSFIYDALQVSLKIPI